MAAEIKRKNDSSSPNIDFSLDEEVTQFALAVPNSDEDIEEKKASKSKDHNGNTKSENEGITLRKKPSGNNKTKKKPLSKFLGYKIEPAPEGLPVVEFIVQPSNIICFYGSNHFLSTFYKSSFEMGGIRYPSVEQYYQATKLYAMGGVSCASRLQNIRDPFKAKSMAKNILRQMRVPIHTIEAWKRSSGLVTLIYAISLKFIQNSDLRKKLLDTNNALLVHAYLGDSFFAVGMDKEEFEKWATEHAESTVKIPYSINDLTLKHIPVVGKGQNVLGAICMKIRHHLRDVPVAEFYDTECVGRLLQKISN